MKKAKTKLSVIEKFFDDYEIQITQCERVIHVNRFITSHLMVLKANSGNQLYLPYYERLEKLYLILKSEL